MTGIEQIRFERRHHSGADRLDAAGTGPAPDPAGAEISRALASPCSCKIVRVHRCVNSVAAGHSLSIAGLSAPAQMREPGPGSRSPKVATPRRNRWTVLRDGRERSPEADVMAQRPSSAGTVRPEPDRQPLTVLMPAAMVGVRVRSAVRWRRRIGGGQGALVVDGAGAGSAVRTKAVGGGLSGGGLGGGVVRGRGGAGGGFFSIPPAETGAGSVSGQSAWSTRKRSPTSRNSYTVVAVERLQRSARAGDALSRRSPTRP